MFLLGNVFFEKIYQTLKREFHQKYIQNLQIYRTADCYFDPTLVLDILFKQTSFEIWPKPEV